MCLHDAATMEMARRAKTRRLSAVALSALLLLGSAATARGQEGAFFVTYNDYLEKPRELEVSLFSTVGDPKDGAPGYFAPWIEIEYGVMPRWTTEVYIEGVAIHEDASAFTGWRWENRFRPFAGDHVVNPVLYIEYESVNEASRIQKEIVGEGAPSRDPVGLLIHQHAHEFEGRLILSKTLRCWDVAGNVIAEKNVSQNEGVEFGYTAGVSRPVGQFFAGLEVYGGLGATVAQHEQTRHFVAPIVAWQLTKGSVVKASVGFGVTSASERYLFRIGYSMDLW